ncbi:ribosomal-processing cysteine protease Prp [Cohnella terricola]|uniref:Ribosomal processing cysteine protease Prp n=1 Tax=Cohnella terricola TaxID=1289167 RepID=A0A559JVZ5_9BACL|nr:ribosomal-processing cysteine protease Prp [Cohnella terricola]TVY04065.1 ribosomal-processing cysteine protease Prp [Cohnella terricola]
MIAITIVRNDKRAIIRFTVTGHAFYNDPGKDIVCAGVSAVAIGAVNAIEKLTGLVPHAVSKSGLLKAEAPLSADPLRNDQVQLLLEGMVAALESIVESYGKYVTIKETFEKKGG